jgi:hypothetical protein
VSLSDGALAALRALDERTRLLDVLRETLHALDEVVTFADREGIAVPPHVRVTQALARRTLEVG